MMRSVVPRTAAPAAALIVLGGVALASAAGEKPAPAPAAPAAKAAPAGAPEASVQVVPKARRMSTYTLLARFEVLNKKVTFETPPAYRESFAFWTDRMMGQRRLEVFELVTITQEAGADGSVPFQRRLPRFNLEMEKKGVPYAPFGPIQSAATKLEWEGSLDRHGRVREIRRTRDVEEPGVKELAFAPMDHLFPVLDGPREMRVGGSFTETQSLPMPQRLNILGLEDIRLIVKRTYTLKKVERTWAFFDIGIDYSLDPATPSKEPNTTCVLSGGGSGEARFDLKRGVFLSTHQPTTLRIDVVAPLRRLPEQPEDFDPGKGTTSIELEILLSGDQTVRRLWGDEDD